ncbi:YfcE family phosphodiesterase [Methanobacterium sp.]|uniref:YfcE family phosphodiesterase n=1 Tax=Methanobacterium sp. TaxID=2164 RepID=UPI002ABA0F57|nr:YfcE family phosphodiesterase [Methanobacterium sp.]MDY9922474.1 YfcE family phosphodiesterase [Methanobacterium sp.]
MLIGVISDTHIPERTDHIPEIVFKVFEGADLILHAGDLVSLEIKDQLEDVAPTICVQGNMDRYRGLDLPQRKKLNLEGTKIGLSHGEVYPRGDTQQLQYIGLEMGVEVLITGHTHWSFIKELPDMLLLNPGSPTVPRLSDPSVMLIELEDGKLDANIVKIGDPICKALNFKGERE